MALDKQVAINGCIWICIAALKFANTVPKPP